MIAGCGMVIHHTSAPASGECDYITFSMLFSIFYWLYRIIKIAWDQMEDDGEEYRQAYNKRYNYESYHRKYQPKNDTYVYNHKTVNYKDKFAEEVGEKVKIRNDIKIINIKR